MRKVSYPVFFLFVVSPFLAFAETAEPYAKYCPDPTDIFTGVAHETEYTPKITVKVNPDFIAKMKRERNVGDLPLTPVYNLVIAVVPTINEYCLPKYNENGAKIREVDPPELFPFNTSLAVGNSVTPDSTLVVGILKRAKKNQGTGEWQYEWKAMGWPNGIVDGAKMENLIKAITQHKPVNVIVEVKRPNKETVYEKYPVSFDLCAPVWGNGRHKIVTMRSSQTNVSYLMPKVDEFHAAFEQTDPFKEDQYKDSFSFFADLKMHDDSRWRTITIDENGNKKFVKGVGMAVTSASSCSSDFHDTHIFFSRIIEQAYALPPIGAAFVHPTDDGTVVLHEFGHVFADLRDEYPYLSGGDLYPTLKAPAFILKMINKISGKNCSFNPTSDFSYNGRLYGTVNKSGCGFGEVGLGASRKILFRSSEGSIMNSHYQSQQFNVVSCGYILATIKGGDAKSYFPECAKMDGIIKDGITAHGTFSSMFAWIGNLFLSPSPLPAQISSAVPDEPQPDYMIVESFDPNNLWGEILEVVPDSQTSTILPAPSIQLPPSNISDISDDSIFDTVSVDLKVNGQDGPIEVEKRARIVLSWISEGATRCRGVWSKNDIKLSGTAAGRITRPVTIKIACIDGEGNRADDEVRVNITE